jgi:hypothetical protein
MGECAVPGHMVSLIDDHDAASVFPSESNSLIALISAKPGGSSSRLKVVEELTKMETREKKKAKI